MEFSRVARRRPKDDRFYPRKILRSRTRSLLVPTQKNGNSRGRTWQSVLSLNSMKRNVDETQFAKIKQIVCQIGDKSVVYLVEFIDEIIRNSSHVVFPIPSSGGSAATSWRA